MTFAELLVAEPELAKHLKSLAEIFYESVKLISEVRKPTYYGTLGAEEIAEAYRDYCKAQERLVQPYRDPYVPGQPPSFSIPK